MKILATALVGAALLAGCSSGMYHSKGMSEMHSKGMSSHMDAKAMSADMPTRAVDGRLVGPNGHTLYSFAKDSTGMSNCNDQCASNWPPLAVAPSAKPMGEYTIIQRADGSQQWAFRGQPLYYFVKDMKSGDMTGDGAAGSWKIVRP